MNKNILWGVVVLMIVIVGGVFYSNKNSSSDLKSNEPIKIGWIGPLTGDASNIGQNVKGAVEIAVDEVNAKGGINGRPLSIIYEDGKCNGSTSASAANKLINIDKVPVIFGGACSGETSSFTSLAKQNNTVVFSYCSSAPALSQAGIFRNYPSDSYQGAFAADYIKNNLGKSKVAVMYVNGDWGVGIKDVFIKRFKEIGGNITDDEGYDQKAKDFRTQITKIKSSNPDAIYFLGYSDATIPALKQFKQMGMNIPLIGGDAWGDAKIATEAGSAAEGIMYTVSKTAPTDEFKSKLSKKVGSNEITVCTPQAYDGVFVLANVLKKVGTDSAEIRKEFYKTVYEGGISSNKISFDANGDLIGAEYTVNKIVNGKPVELK